MDLAVLYQNNGKYSLAEPLYKRALAIYEKTLGPEHPDLAGILANVAAFYEEQGDHAAAESLHQRAAAIRAKH